MKFVRNLYIYVKKPKGGINFLPIFAKIPTIFGDFCACWYEVFLNNFRSFCRYYHTTKIMIFWLIFVKILLTKITNIFKKYTLFEFACFLIAEADWFLVKMTKKTNFLTFSATVSDSNIITNAQKFISLQINMPSKSEKHEICVFWHSVACTKSAKSSKMLNFSTFGVIMLGTNSPKFLFWTPKKKKKVIYFFFFYIFFSQKFWNFWKFCA